MSTENEILKKVANEKYKYGFVSKFESEKIQKGLNENVIKLISNKRNEPEWLLNYRLKAFKKLNSMSPPKWANIEFKEVDLQSISYYSAMKKKKKYNSLKEVDPELLSTFKRLGISIEEQKRLTGVAMDVVVDSVSVATTFQKELKKLGIIFCPISEAIQKHPDLVKKYLGSVVPISDNYYATLNSAVFTDGSFCYIPKGVKCPMELSTYFRINEAGTGQFERTLVIADEESYVSYKGGAPTSRCRS